MLSCITTALVCFSFPHFSYVYSISVSAPATSMVSVILGSNLSSEFPTPLDGSVLFVIDQLNSYNESTTDSAHIGGYEFNPGHTVPVNLSSIPTLKFPSGDVLAFLLCSPHVSIQTRQVLAAGNGNLTLMSSHGLWGLKNAKSVPVSRPAEISTEDRHRRRHRSTTTGVD